MEYRVDELAAAAGVSVSAIRAYQSKGLLPPPRHRGRVAVYTDRHRERVREIQELKAQGHSLLVIGRLLDPGRVASNEPDIEDGRSETFTLRELSDRTGVPIAMLRSLEGSGLLRSLHAAGSPYTEADVRAVRLLLTMLGDGVPMEEVIRVAKIQLEVADQIAAECVRLFMIHVRDKVRASGLTRTEEAERVVAALRTMLHGTTSLLAYSFQRIVLNAAADELNESGTRAERTALAKLAPNLGSLSGL